METFGRGCLYCILEVIILLLISVFIGRTINIPWIIFIPMVALTFYVASKKSNK